MKIDLRHLLRPRSFGRFTLTGAINTFFGVTTFPVLYVLLGRFLSVNTLVVLAWILTTGSAFLIHKRVTFMSSGAYHREAIKFLLLCIGTLGINLAVMDLMRRYTHVHPIVIQFVTSVLLSAALMVISYVSMNYLIFKKPDGVKDSLSKRA